MSTEVFLNGRVTLHGGDCRDVLKTIADNSIHSIVCDPPYALVSIVKRFANSPRNERTENTENPYGRTGRGFMGQRWDNGETAFAVEFWAECLRVLKPGGHVVAFSGTRTYHRMACAIEDAGFEIRDQLQWVYGSGFPKSHDVSKGIDKAAGAEREKVRDYNPHNPKATGGGRDGLEGATRPWIETAIALGYHEKAGDVPVTEDAIQWQGWGTALKPACEPICFARKPLIGTVAANVLAHGTGAINIDGCRVGTDESLARPYGGENEVYGKFLMERGTVTGSGLTGRWPANIIHDGSDEVIAAFPESAGGAWPAQGIGFGYSGGERKQNGVRTETNDSGSAARFFYQASKDDRCDLCDANIVASSSPTENIQIGNTAGSDVPVSHRPESAVIGHRPNGHASNAANLLPPCHQLMASIAAQNAPTSDESRIVQNVSNAANLCGSCATAIAQEIVAASRSEPLGSSVSKCSIDDSKKTILLRCLASYVAGRENTDIILTTTNLRELFGCVFHAIGESIRSAKAGSGASTEPAPKRLWYSAKADANDRLGSKHPTVKPVDLMQWLCRLVTPKGGTILDPFAGTGTTGEAAFREGFNAVLIEREAEYQTDIRRRMALCMAGPDERKRESIKAKTQDQPADHGPLFSTPTDPPKAA